MFRLVLVLVALWAGATPADARQPAPSSAVSQASPGPATADEGSETAAAEEAGAHVEGEVHEETIWGPISRAFNSAVLFGVLYYFLRKPVADYLTSRDNEIRNDLLTAAAMTKAATEQLAALEQKLAALPGELEILRARGQEEIVAEEARIEQAAASDRSRLLDQTRREIDLQLRIAQRELVEHAANLAVGLAREGITRQITADDQAALMDRYLQQVKS
jgi:F-type H+-transporting ATPase subunit b